MEPVTPARARGTLPSQGSTSSEESLDPSLARTDDRDVYEELMILHQAVCSDFQPVRVVRHGSQGSILAVRCTLDDLPPNKLYALKVFYHDKPNCSQQKAESRRTQGEASSSSPVATSDLAAASALPATGAAPSAPCDATEDFQAFRTARQNEWRTLSSALRHRNIIRIWTCFEDNITDELWAQLPEQAKSAIESSASARGGRLAQFVLFDHHEQSVADYLKNRANRSSPPPYTQAKKWAMQLLDVACFLKQKHVVHCDLKLEHLLLTSNHDIVVTGFSRAKHLRVHHLQAYLRGGDAYPADNKQHIAPEVINQFARVAADDGKQPPMIDFGGQTCWAVGVLIYEFLMQAHPLPDYPDAYIVADSNQVAYSMERVGVKPLPAEYLAEFNSLVMALLDPDPHVRPDVADAKRRLYAVHDGSVHYQLSKCEAQLQEQRLKSAELQKQVEQLRVEKVDLVQRRIGIVKERKALQAQVTTQQQAIADLEDRYAKLNALVIEYEDKPLKIRLKDAEDRHEDLQKRWIALNKEKEETVDELDEANRQRRHLGLDIERMKTAGDEAASRLEQSERQRVQLETDLERLNHDYGELYSRERKYSTESRRVKDGHMLTMRDLDGAQARIQDLEAHVENLTRQLQEREMEVIRARAGTINPVAQPVSPYSTAPKDFRPNSVPNSGGGAGSGYELQPIPDTPVVTIPVIQPSSSGGGGPPYSVSMEASRQIATSPPQADAPDSSLTSSGSGNVTGYQGKATSGPYLPQPSVSSGTRTPATPPPGGPIADPLGNAVDKQHTPPHRANSIPCLTPGCDFYGLLESDYLCSKCSKLRASSSSAAQPAPPTRPSGACSGGVPIRSMTAPLARVREDGDDVRRRLDMSTGRKPCSERDCQNEASDEYGGRCAQCFFEMTKKQADLEDEQRAYGGAATLGGFPPGTAQQPQPPYAHAAQHSVTGVQHDAGVHPPPQRSQSMYQQAVPPSDRYTTMPERKVCRSMGCMQPALPEFGGFCLYCYQSKTTTPFYNEGVERCLNAQCVRAGERTYGGVCRECYMRSTTELAPH
eukprot:scpid56118/ scgid9633/ Serine/threonine-protein kinase Nek1; NimA-related protein kinase 1